MAGRLTILAAIGGLGLLAVEVALGAGFDVQLLASVRRMPIPSIEMQQAERSNLAAINHTLRQSRPKHVLIAGSIPVSGQMREDLVQISATAGAIEVSAPTAPGDADLSKFAFVLPKLTSAECFGIQEIAPDLLTPAGHIAGPQPDTVLVGIGAFDIRTAREGRRLDSRQAVAASGWHLLAAEDAGGTDALLARPADFGARGLVGDGRLSLVLAEACEPQQSLAVDLPAVGHGTAPGCRAAGVMAIALQADHVSLIHRVESAEAADRAGIAASGLADA